MIAISWLVILTFYGLFAGFHQIRLLEWLLLIPCFLVDFRVHQIRSVFEDHADALIRISTTMTEFVTQFAEKEKKNEPTCHD